MTEYDEDRKMMKQGHVASTVLKYSKALCFVTLAVLPWFLLLVLVVEMNQ